MRRGGSLGGVSPSSTLAYSVVTGFSSSSPSRTAVTLQHLYHRGSLRTQTCPRRVRLLHLALINCTFSELKRKKAASKAVSVGQHQTSVELKRSGWRILRDKFYLAEHLPLMLLGSSIINRPRSADVTVGDLVSKRLRSGAANV